MTNVGNSHRLSSIIGIEDNLILFDGVCRLCNAWSRFIIRHDKKRIFRLASVQSAQGQQILEHFGMPTDHFDTMLYVERYTPYEKSEAFLRVTAKLGFPWTGTRVLWLVPRAIRDWFYDRIALNRYRLFGRYDRCLLPAPDHDQRFLNDAE